MSQTHKGFTIVELLVVIVVIGILAAVTIVSYTGISSKAVTASLQSDLTSAQKLIKLFQVENSQYPTLINDCPTPSSGNLCIKSSTGNSYTYQVDNVSPQSFTLYASNGTINYKVTSESQPSQTSLVCPIGFITVPGSSTYGTNDFCVMKYEAKQASSTVPISRSSGLPWSTINETDSATYSANVVGCTGCHLITEPEWLTIAQNVLGVASNWSGGIVGSGYIYSGNNDNNPGVALEADLSDANGYYGTNNASGNQKRTLTLSNGEVIWDLAGNLYEWVDASIAGSAQPGLSGESAYAWKQWNNGSLLQNGFPSTSMPAYTGYSGASGWSSTQGIGQVYSNYGETLIKYYRRGGNYGAGTGAGVLAVSLSGSANNVSAIHGFRVAK